MSLGIVFKGAEGIVLAADSRVTLFAQVPNPQGPQGQNSLLIPATFDNATKLFRIASQRHIAAVTYGAGAIGNTAPRTASSFVPELESELQTAAVGRLTVQDFAQRLSDFFSRQWSTAGMPNPTQPGQDMVFYVAGYDDDASPYGRVFEISIPSRPIPNELIPNQQFGVIWGGQREFTDRLLQGFDSQLPSKVFDILRIPAAQRNANLEQGLKNDLSVRIPWQFLPLQDCVDLAIFLVRTTIEIQRWVVGVRGVGGAIDVGTITRVEGFKPIQLKTVVGEDYPTTTGE